MQHNGHLGPCIFSAKDVEIQFNLRGKTLTAVRKASLDLYQGETMAIVGESGSGKSVFTKSFIGMLDKNGAVTGGQLLYRGQDLTQFKTEKEWLAVRGKKIAMVFQDPMTSLNPVRTIGEQITEVITWHFGTPHAQARQEAIEILKKVGISDAETRYKQYPHEFSGGMRQRVVIATAIACRPEILICDEPTTALDVTVQAQILNLIRELQRELKMTVVYITHDLGVVANVADWVSVMYAGQIVETGTAEEIFSSAVHPYTKALLRSMPQLGVKGHDLYSIQGTPPNLFKEIKGARHIGTYIAADEHIHDVLTNCQLAGIQPHAYIMDPLKFIGLPDASIHPFPVIGKEHPADLRQITFALPYLRTGCTAHCAVMNQIHSDLFC